MIPLHRRSDSRCRRWQPVADSRPSVSRVAASLALVAAFLFALAATLQQKGALNLPAISLADPMSLLRLAGQTTWLIGTLALFTGYLFQAGALDRGRLSIIQPLLVTTVVFALPLGYFLTGQHVGRREVIGAVVIIIGLGLFVSFGDPAGGNENASNSQWAIAIGLLSVLSVLTLVFGRGGSLAMKAAVYGTVAGVLFGLSSALTKPTLNYLHESVGTMLSHWECYALAAAGVLGFVLQQVSLGTGRLAPSVATVSVANPLVGILIGILLLDERLSRPGWHILVAVVGLGLALVGAVVISLAREATGEQGAAADSPERSVATA
jgi:drug/metabolite transporter (DMT)-like permease